MGAEEQREDQPFVLQLGPIVIDVPRTIGFYSGVAAALAFELIAPELALFVAAIPLVKLMKRKRATKPEIAVAGVLEGMMKPLGGDAESVVRPKWVEEEKEKQQGKQRGRQSRSR